MLITATQKYTRQSPRKVRLVANAVKKMSIEAAFKQLAIMERRASVVVMKTLRQAVANAMNNHRYALADLSIADIQVGEGPKYKRFQAVSRGRAHSIIKRTSHITVTLKTAEAAVEKKAEGIKPVKPAVQAESTEKAKTTSKSKQQVVAKDLSKGAAKARQSQTAAKKTVNRTTHK